MAHRQRAAKRQPTGRSVNEGGAPGIENSLVRSARARSGRAAISELVYRWRGSVNRVFVGAVSTMRPAYITDTRSVCPATTPRSWVMRITPIWYSSRSSSMRSRICICVVTSRAVVGSSAMRMRGWHTSAMAIMTRWRMPPDSWCG